VVKKWCIKKDKLGNAPFPAGRSNDVIDEENTTETIFATGATFLEEGEDKADQVYVTEVPNQLYEFDENAPELKAAVSSQQFDSTNFDKLTDFESVVTFSILFVTQSFSSSHMNLSLWFLSHLVHDTVFWWPMRFNFHFKTTKL
jgi:hypothetical protein